MPPVSVEVSDVTLPSRELPKAKLEISLGNVAIKSPIESEDLSDTFHSVYKGEAVLLKNPNFKDDAGTEYPENKERKETLSSEPGGDFDYELDVDSMNDAIREGVCKAPDYTERRKAELYVRKEYGDKAFQMMTKAAYIIRYRANELLEEYSTESLRTWLANEGCAHPERLGRKLLIGAIITRLVQQYPKYKAEHTALMC